MLKIYGEHDDNTVKQMWQALGTGSVHKGVLCADGHYGYAHPIGGVIAYEDHISVSGVGFDIACGNLAVKLDLDYDDIAACLPTIARDIGRKISFGLGRVNETRVEHEMFDDGDAWHAAGADHLKEMARAQLGTVGGGNHYVDLFRDAKDAHVWIGVHFGSRGLGHKMTNGFLKKLGATDRMDAAPTILEASSDLGAQYAAAIALGGRYAYAGREWVVGTIRRMLAAKVVKTVHNHHNFAWRETHGGRDYWVVRKGATPAFAGQEGFVGGSMGDDAVILVGLDTNEARESLYSTVHGAGRTISRRKAKETFTASQMDAWLEKKGVLRVGGDLDESPMAYRRLDAVLAHHAGGVKVTHRLEPILVMMAGREVRDPYKD